MNNKGFIMMETIVAVVILTASLLILYSSFTSILKKEKTRVFYDDPAYIYRTLYLKDALTSLDLNTYLDTYLNNTDNYFITLGMDSENLFLNKEYMTNYLNNLLVDYDVKQILIIKKDKLNDLKKCTLACANDKNCVNFSNCNLLYLNLDDNFISYLKTINFTSDTEYGLVAYYNTCNSRNVCQNYYSWVSV